MRRVRVTVSMDADAYEYALAESRERKLPISEMFRWMLRDGMVHRQELAAKYLEIERARREYGW